MKHCIEITEELFYTMKNSGDAATEVVSAEKYTDVFYFKYGVTFFARTQNGYCNYYIQDINA